MKIKHKRKIIILILIFSVPLLLCFVILLLIRSTKPSSAEKIAVENYAKTYTKYLANFEPIPDSEHQPTIEQQYSMFALDYFHYEKNQNEIPIADFKNFIQETFDYNIDTTDPNIFTTSDLIIKKGISANIDDDKINVNYPELDKKARAHIALNYFAQNEIKKSHDSFEVDYDQYEIETPYDMLNCLAETESPNTAKLMSYLKAETNINTALDAISLECAQKITEPKAQITVTYGVKNNKFFIQKIKY